MNIFLNILIFLTIFSCSTNKNKLENDYIVTNVFDKKEIQELRTLLALFDDSLKHITQKNNTIEAYYTFTDSLKYWKEIEDYYSTKNSLKLTVFKAIELFENGNLFKNSIYINNSWDSKSNNKQDTISVSWKPIYDGKYFNFITNLSKRDERFLNYKNGIEQSGTIPLSSEQFFSLTSRQINFEVESNRIAFIFHYLILLSEKEN